MDEIKEKARQDYMQGMKYKDICDKYNLSMNTLKSWVSRHKWAAERKKRNKKGAHNRKRGAPLNNKNAVGNPGGNGPPKKNKNAVTHGLYETVIVENFNDEDKRLWGLTDDVIDLKQELKLARFKLARLLQRYPGYKLVGTDITKDGEIINYNLKDEFFDTAIMQGLDIIRKLTNDIYKAEIVKEKLEIERAKVFGTGEGDEDQEGIDSFIKATKLSEEEAKALFEDDDNEDIQKEN